MGIAIPSIKLIAESIARRNIVRKNRTEKNAEAFPNKASVSGMTAKARLGHHFTTSVTSTQFVCAKNPSVPNTAIAERNEIKVFPAATSIVALTISVFSLLRAPYAIITHIATESVKNICPHAAVQVESSQSFSVGVDIRYQSPSLAHGSVIALSAIIISVIKGIVAVNHITFPTDFAPLHVKPYVSKSPTIVHIATGIDMFPVSDILSVIPSILLKKKSLPFPAHGRGHQLTMDLNE